jgi:hypothetical protein
MIEKSADSLLLDVRARVEELERLVSSMGHLEKIFPDLNYAGFKTEPAEAAFMRTTAWLYILYWETGKASVVYLVDIGKKWQTHRGEELDFHYRLVAVLRTYMQHNLSLSSNNDCVKKKMCEKWFKSSCGTSVPVEEEHWGCCLKVLLNGAYEFLDVLVSVVRRIEGDEDSGDMLSDWTLRVERYHAPHEFDRVIEEAASDMGREGVSAVVFRRRYLEIWNKSLSLCAFPYDFDQEARKLVEQALLSEPERVLPLTGKDLIERFDMTPGPEVGRLLKQADELFTANPCAKEELLIRLAEVKE